MVDHLEANGIGILFVIGGDGTIRGAMQLTAEVERRGLKIAVVGVPKTIDNDIHFIDRSFGFESAYSAGGRGRSAARASRRWGAQRHRAGEADGHGIPGSSRARRRSRLPTWISCSFPRSRRRSKASAACSAISIVSSRAKGHASRGSRRKARRKI